MATIDLSHNSAPLQGSMRPALEEVNRLLRGDPLVVWDCPAQTSARSADKNFSRLRISMLCGLIGMGVVGFFFNTSIQSPLRPATPPPAVKEHARVVPLSSVKQSLYLVVRRPNAEFVSYLSQLAARGITVRMVTSADLASSTGITVSTVKPEQIPGDGVLIDGTSWYVIGPDSVIK
jgi:hypothetical protein